MSRQSMIVHPEMIKQYNEYMRDMGGEEIRMTDQLDKQLNAGYQLASGKRISIDPATGKDKTAAHAYYPDGTVKEIKLEDVKDQLVIDYKSAALAAVHEGMSDLYEAGMLVAQTMSEFDKSCLENKQMLADEFTVNSPEYIAAQLYFSQQVQVYKSQQPGISAKIKKDVEQYEHVKKLHQGDLDKKDAKYLPMPKYTKAQIGQALANQRRAICAGNRLRKKLKAQERKNEKGTGSN